MRSPVTDQGLRMAVTLIADALSSWFIYTDPDDATGNPFAEPNSSGTWLLFSQTRWTYWMWPGLYWSSGRIYEFVASGALLAYAIYGVTSVQRAAGIIGQLQVRSIMAPLKITGITGGSGSNITITVDDPGYAVSGESSMLVYDTGTDLDTISWEVEAVTDNGSTLSIELTGSSVVDATSYNSRGVAVDESRRQVGRAILGWFQQGSTGFPRTYNYASPSAGGYCYARFNGHQHFTTDSAGFAVPEANDRNYQWFYDRWWFSPFTPEIPLDAASSIRYIFGELYGAAISARGASTDTIQADSSGRYWWQFSDGTQTNPMIWIALSVSGYN